MSVDSNLAAKTGTLILIASASISGTSGIFTKLIYISGFVEPLNVSLLRIAMATAALASLIFAAKKKDLLRVHRRDLPVFALIGALGVGAASMLYLTALSKTTVTNALLLIYTAPAFVGVMAYAFLRERINRYRSLAIATSMVGAALVVGVAKGVALFASEHLAGDLVAIGSGLSYATLFILIKFQTRRYDQLVTLFYALMFAAVFILPAATFIEGLNFSMPTAAWIYFLGLALFSTSTGYTLYVYGLKFLDASKASVYMLFEPVVGITLASVIFGEVMDVWVAAGASMILGSVFLTYSKG